MYIYIIKYIYIYTRIYAPGPAAPPPPLGWSHILLPSEILPLPPCGVVELSPSPLWCGGGVVLSLSPRCGVVEVWYCSPPPLWCGGGVVWHVGYGVYGRSGMACLESMVCLVCMVGMLCMA